MFSVLLGIYLAVYLLGHMVILCLWFLSSYSILHSHHQCTRFPTSQYPHQHLLFIYLIITVVVMRGYIIIVLILISLMIKDEQLFICLLAICISFLEKCLFKSFAHFKIELPTYLLLGCRSSLRILGIDPYQNHDFQIFSPIL